MAENKKELTQEVLDEALTAAAEAEHPQDDQPETDKDGFIVLESSEEGKKAEIKWAASKIVDAPFGIRPETETDQLELLLSGYTVAAQTGRYADIHPTEDQMNDILKFIGSYHPETSDIGTQEYAIAKMLLMIGKSVYEYATGVTFLSDISYDALLAAWKKVHVEPTGIVPANIPGKEKVKLKFPELSNNLDKAYRIMSADKLPVGVKEEDSVEEFLNRTYDTLGLKDEDALQLVLSPKIDGVSVNTIVSGGRLTSPASRGDSDSNLRLKGLEGFRIRGSKKDVPKHDPIPIQYEAFVTKGNKKIASQMIGTDYVNCRSCASGLINRMAADPEARKYAKLLSFYPINAVSEKPYAERLNEIDKFGRVPKDMPGRIVLTGNKKELLAEIKKHYDNLLGMRNTLSFDIDGMVISILDDEQQEKTGRTGRTNLWQIAMKFEPASAIGYVDNISMSFGNKGRRTIMVNLKEPAVIDGVEYPSIPVLSTGSYDDLGLRVGSKIEVIRTGDVIPTFVVLDPGDGELIQKPTVCPACGEKLTEEESGHLRCDNENCPKNIVGRFITLFTVLGLDSYDEEFATSLMEKAKITNLSQLLDLTTEQLHEAGIQGKIEDQFVDLLHTTLKSSPDYRILAALGLPGISKERAKAILSAIDFDKLDDLTIPEVEDILTREAGFKKMAGLFATEIISSRDLIKKWFKAAEVKKTDFKNLKVVGHSGANIPEDVAKKILDAGYDITDGRRFDLLVIPDINYTSRKVNVAKAKSIPIVTLEVLQQYVDGKMEDLFNHNFTGKNGNKHEPKLEEVEIKPEKNTSKSSKEKPPKVIPLGPGEKNDKSGSEKKTKSGKAEKSSKPEVIPKDQFVGKYYEKLSEEDNQTLERARRTKMTAEEIVKAIEAKSSQNNETQKKKKFDPVGRAMVNLSVDMSRLSTKAYCTTQNVIGKIHSIGM